MSRNVAIVGIGYTNFRPLTPEVSYKELMYEAAVKAYEDAGIDPRRDIDSLVTVAEDFLEGTSIFDEYVPDQLGGLLKPNVTIPGEAIHGLATAYMQIASGLFDIVAVEAHSKASNVLTLPYITAYAMDPVLNRPLAANPVFIAGMEMNRYLHMTGATREQCAQVVAKNKSNALYNPAAAYGAAIEPEDVLHSEMIAYPLTRQDISPHADGAIVLVLAARFTAVGIPIAVAGRRGTQRLRRVTVMTWGGLRGGISVALALSLPAETLGEGRDVILAMTYIVVVFAIVVQGVTFGKLLKRSGLVQPEDRGIDFTSDGI